MTARRRKSRGFSLVEVLVGVMILGLVVSPLLHTMVTAMNTAAKGRRAQNLNMIAQNLVETVDANTIAALTGVIPADAITLFDSNDAQYYAPDGDSYKSLDNPDASHFYLGLTKVTYPGSSVAYDAMIELDATPHDQNKEEVSVYTAMDSLFTQPSGEGMDPDLTAAALFAQTVLDKVNNGDYKDKGVIDSTPGTQNFYLGTGNASMSRTMTIQQTARAGEDAAFTGTVTFSYTAGCTLKTTDGQSVTVSMSSSSDPMPVTVADVQSQGAPKALYFFFYPNSSGSDTINIRRTDSNALRIFLVQQTPPGHFESSISVSPRVNLFEPVTNPIKPHTELYLNFSTLDSNGSDEPQVRFLTTSNYLPIPLYRNNFAAHKGLVVQSVQHRIYTVAVTLYSAGAGFASDARLATLTATTIK